MNRCRDCKYKRYINNSYGNQSIYMQSPCFMCKWNPEDNKSTNKKIENEAGYSLSDEWY